MFFWLFPPIKNRKTEYFAYFLILAFADPVKFLFTYMFGYQNSSISLIIATLLVVSLLKNTKIQIALIGLSLFLPVCMVILKAPPMCYFYFSILASFSLLLIAAMQITQFLLQNRSINLFLVLLLLYISITFFRKLAVLIDPDLGVLSYTIGLAFQMFFAIAFTFININTKNYRLIKDY